MLGIRPVLRPILTKKRATATFLGSSVSASNLTTYTFSGVSLGTAGTRRRIIVAANMSPTVIGRTVSSLTVGGANGTLVPGARVETAATGSEMELWYADVPATIGATGNIVVTYTASVGRCGVGWWVTDPEVFPVHSATSTADPGTGTVMVPCNGFVIAAQGTYRVSGLPTYTWTELTEDYDQSIEAGGNTHTGAHKDYEGSAFITATCTPSAFSATAFVMASFR